MKRLLFIILINLSANVLAYEELWKMGKEFVPLLKDEANGILVSKNCEKKKCEALKFIKRISLKKLDAKDLSGGKNPGAVLCHLEDEARIIFLKDLHGNENSFCMLKDHSFISTSTLYIYAQKNDELKK